MRILQRMRNSAVLVILVALAAGGLRSTAFADEPAPAPPALRFRPKTEFAPKPSRTPALIATGASGAIIAAAVFSYVKFHQAAMARRHDNVLNPTPIDNHYVERQEREVAEQLKWKNRTVGLVIGTAIAAAVTGYLWSRREGYRRVSVTPTTKGAQVSFSRSF